MDGRCHDNCTTTLELTDSLASKAKRTFDSPYSKVRIRDQTYIRTEGQIAQKREE